MKVRRFSRKLCDWFRQNGRDLPWRRTHDPYKIWISEVILQQTRVDQGLEYYIRFIERFPDASSLARSTEEEVLKEWQGLGYYSRGRNLHQAAREIADRYGGMFPVRYEDIVRLKGIGPYTAAAISSIAFGEPIPVVDGNVRRVLSRFLGPDAPAVGASREKAFRKFLEEHIDRRNPGLFNEAVMELGALVCTPKNPGCKACPLNFGCKACQEGSVASYPLRESKPIARNRYFHYFVLHIIGQREASTWMRKRPQGDIWAGLYEFPLLETPEPFEPEAAIAVYFKDKLPGPARFNFVNATSFMKHRLTHQIINACFIELTAVKGEIRIYDNPYINVSLSGIDRLPVSRLIEKYLTQPGSIFKKSSL